MRSRSSRLPMSPATRRSASARWRRWATSSARRAPLTMAPRPSAATRATSRSRGPERSLGLADDQQDAPWTVDPGDDDRELGPAVCQHGEGEVIVGIRQEQTGQRCVAGARAPDGQTEDAAEDPVPARQLDQPMRIGDIGGGRRSRQHPIAAELPGDDQVMAIGVPDGGDRCEECLVGILAGVDQPADAGRDGQVEPVALGVERIAPCEVQPVAAASREAWGRGRVHGPPAAPRAGRGLRRAVHRPGLGGGQEPLQVTDPVAPIATRIDPVVPKPPGVAPCPDRVRVDAQQPGGLGDRQGGVRGPWRDRDRHGSLEEM